MARGKRKETEAKVCSVGSSSQAVGWSLLECCGLTTPVFPGAHTDTPFSCLAFLLVFSGKCPGSLCRQNKYRVAVG